MAITDPEAIKFTNDYIRPMCENLRYMAARGSDWALKWAELSSKFPNKGDQMIEQKVLVDLVAKILTQLPLFLRNC